MNRSLAAAVLILAVASGCAGRGKRTSLDRAPKQPPAYPAPQNVAIDPGLQAAAKQEIVVALDSNDPLIRSHAIEAARESIGAPAGDMIIKHLTDNAAVVRFAAAVAAGELRLTKAKDALLVMSDDADPSVRVGAKFALHRLGDVRQSHDLEAASRDPSPRTPGDT